MDIGFRLTKHATLRQFAVSVDLALLLIDSVNELRLYFDGEAALKGVLREQKYPLIWVDMLDHPCERKDILRGTPPEPYELQKFCRDFIGQTCGEIMVPFFTNDSRFAQKPEHWDQRYDEAVRILTEEDEPKEESAEDSGGKTVPPDISETLLKTASRLTDELKEPLAEPEKDATPPLPDQ
jgi:hypothetical protein